MNFCAEIVIIEATAKIIQSLFYIKIFSMFYKKYKS